MRNWEQDRIYHRTAAGDAAIGARQRPIPADYRRILRLIGQDTHSDAVRGRLRQYPDALLTDWLNELEELGYVSSRSADYADDFDFTLFLEAQPEGLPLPEDFGSIHGHVLAAQAALYETGKYLSGDRLRKRAPLAKALAQTTVLIVEDDPDQLALADVRVGMAGYGVRVARNRVDLLKHLESQPLPDLVLLDVLLPDGNGFEILSEMRASPTLSMLPVIMLTALQSEEDVARGLALGVDGYITKPYSKKVLEDTIGIVLGHI